MTNPTDKLEKKMWDTVSEAMRELEEFHDEKNKKHRLARCGHDGGRLSHLSEHTDRLRDQLRVLNSAADKFYSYKRALEDYEKEYRLVCAEGAVRSANEELIKAQKAIRALQREREDEGARSRSRSPAKK